MIGWDEAVAYALTLPDTELSTYFGGPAVKITGNGRAFLTRGHESRDSFCIQIDRDRIEMLKETDPESFYQTPHYVGWDAVLVRYHSPDPERVRDIIAEARDYTAAKKPAKPRKKKA
jgi:hypothetical protein